MFFISSRWGVGRSSRRPSRTDPCPGTLDSNRRPWFRMDAHVGTRLRSESCTRLQYKVAATLWATLCILP